MLTPDIAPLGDSQVWAFYEESVQESIGNMWQVWPLWSVGCRPVLSCAGKVGAKADIFESHVLAYLYSEQQVGRLKR